MRLDDRIAGKVKALRCLEDARNRAGMNAVVNGQDYETGYARECKVRATIDRVKAQLLALQAKRDALREACRAAVTESGLVPCDVPWCACPATHKWVRTAKEIKASRVKVKGCVQEMTPESIRCETHLPDWRVGQYARLVQSAAVKVAPAALRREV